MTKKIGVLALQGAVDEHLASLSRIGVKGIAVKTRQQLQQVDGLIIPGGESTTIRRMMQQYDLFDAVQQFGRAGKGVLGTCAGMVLMAKEIEGGEEGLELMDYKVRRNGFGRQVDSFEAALSIPVLGEKPFQAVFIRAPWIEQVAKKTDVLAYSDDKIVAVRHLNLLATAFHPELTSDDRLILFFVEQCVD